LATSNDPADWETAVARQGAITEYLRSHSADDSAKTKQMRAWRDQIQLALAERELVKLIDSARKFSVEKMDALTDVERKALKAAQAEEEGNLVLARQRWEELLKDSDDGPYSRIARQRVDLTYPAVKAAETRLAAYLGPQGSLHQSGKEPAPSDRVEQQALRAYRYEDVGDLYGARPLWRALGDSVKDDPGKRTWYLLAVSHTHDLKERGVESDPKERADAVAAYLAKGKKLRAESKLSAARVYALNVIFLYGDDPKPEFEKVLTEARELLKQIKKELGES
jgi:hypothetical protein